MCVCIRMPSAMLIPYALPSALQIICEAQEKVAGMQQSGEHELPV